MLMHVACRVLQNGWENASMKHSHMAQLLTFYRAFMIKIRHFATTKSLGSKQGKSY